MTKKTRLIKDYTPEQLWKLERRLMRQDIRRNPESQQLCANVIVDIAGAGNARNEALAFDKASEEMGRADFYKWCAENPLSPRAALHNGMIQKEKDAPDVALAGKFRTKKPKGSMSKRTQYIHKLATDSPNKSAKELLQLEGVRDAIGRMVDGTFANHVTEARKSKK